MLQFLQFWGVDPADVREGTERRHGDQAEGKFLVHLPLHSQEPARKYICGYAACTFPEYLVMSIIYYMGKHSRTPYRFKTVYEVYHEFKQTWVTS